MLLSAPPMTVLVVLVLVWVFRSDLKAIMSRIATIKFPGGEISTTSQIDRSAKTGSDELPPGSTLGLARNRWFWTGCGNGVRDCLGDRSIHGSFHGPVDPLSELSRMS